jgi:hypothetical protein
MFASACSGTNRIVGRSFFPGAEESNTAVRELPLATQPPYPISGVMVTR